MMISPEAYYELYLKGKDEKQILSAIRGLKNEIGHLKNVMEHPEYASQITVRPSEDTRLWCNRLYLRILGFLVNYRKCSQNAHIVSFVRFIA